MKSLLFALALIMAIVIPGGAEAKRKAKDNRAYFVFRDVAGAEFVIMLKDREKIVHARALLAGKVTDAPHVSGTIVKSRASYNRDWSFHLDPASIEFFDFSIEVCDASIQYVEEHLAEVGSDFLPGNHWCPWSSELVREIPRPSKKR